MLAHHHLGDADTGEPAGQLLDDDRPTTDQADIKTSKNYVDAALTEAMAGKPVAHHHRDVRHFLLAQ